MLKGLEIKYVQSLTLIKATNTQDGIIITNITVVRIRQGKKWTQASPKWKKRVKKSYIYTFRRVSGSQAYSELIQLKFSFKWEMFAEKLGSLTLHDPSDLMHCLPISLYSPLTLMTRYDINLKKPIWYLSQKHLLF